MANNATATWRSIFGPHDLTETYEPGPDCLTTLPVEIFVMIVKQLAPREMCLLRAQNHAARDLIDANEQQLTKEIIEHHRARLLQHYELISTRPTDIILRMEQLRQYYGPHLHGYDGKLAAISSTLAFQLWPRTWLNGFASHLQAPLARMLGCFSVLQNLRDTQDTMFPHASAYNRALHVNMLQLSQSVRLDTASDALEVARRCEAVYEGPPVQQAEPAFLLTSRSTVAGDFCQGRCSSRPSYWCCSGMLDVERSLNVPDLAVTMNCCLAYGTDDPGVVAAVKRVGEGLAVLAQLKLAYVAERILIW